MNKEQIQKLTSSNKAYFSKMIYLTKDEIALRADISTASAVSLYSLLSYMQGEYRESLESLLSNYGDFSDKLNTIYNVSVEKSIERRSTFSEKFIELQREEFLRLIPTTVNRLRKAESEHHELERAALLASVAYLFSIKRAVTSARNNTNSLRNCECLETLRQQGYKYKTWKTVMDGKERYDHAVANGQRVPIDEPFVVGGYQMMFPRDTSYGAPTNQIVNCRCMVVGG